MSAEIQQVYERPDYFGLVVSHAPPYFWLSEMKCCITYCWKFQGFSTEKWVEL